MSDLSNRLKGLGPAPLREVEAYKLLKAAHVEIEMLEDLLRGSVGFKQQRDGWMLRALRAEAEIEELNRHERQRVQLSGILP